MKNRVPGSTPSYSQFLHVALIALPLLALWPFPAFGGTSHRAARTPDSTFGALIQRLSGPGGYFDTDNLISNEASYLHVVDKMKELGIEGGVYIGVGPDQNFSYIAHLRPQTAFILDIRRDNLLLHLFFKSLFHLARNRIEYLCLLFDRPPPRNLMKWNTRTVNELVDYIDATSPADGARSRIDRTVQATVLSFGVPLTRYDLETIRRVHAGFIDAGLDLRFTSTNRPPRSYYPTYRELSLEKDLEGHSASYLAREEYFQYVKGLQERNRIVPVVGDLAGGHALREISEYVKEKGLRVSVLYTSNVEFYLMRQGRFSSFADNVEGLPWRQDGVIVRSLFHSTYRHAHPQAIPGYASTQLLQRAKKFISLYRDGAFRSYFDLVSQGFLDVQEAAP